MSRHENGYCQVRHQPLRNASNWLAEFPGPGCGFSGRYPSESAAGCWAGLFPTVHGTEIGSPGPVRLVEDHAFVGDVLDRIDGFRSPDDQPRGQDADPAGTFFHPLRAEFRINHPPVRQSTVGRSTAPRASPEGSRVRPATGSSAAWGRQ